MRVGPLPKRWLIHEIIYEGYTGQKDDWGNDLYEKPITIKHVRFDDSTVFSRDNTQTKVLANAVIFVDEKYSNPLPTIFKEQSKIHFNGKDYVLQKAIPCFQPTENKIHHWELEVI